MDPRILELSREPPQYAYEAYEFVCDAVTFTQERAGRGAGGADRHVTGPELLRGACDLAVATFGMMAPVVFRSWNVRTTDDVGRIVFALIRAGLLSQSDRDAPEDFRDVFDLPRALAEGFEFTLDDRAGAPRA